MKSIHVGNKLYINADEILCACPPDRLPKDILKEAIDVAANKARTAVIMRTGTVYLVDVSLETLLARAGK